MHTCLETSYTQAQAQAAHVKREIFRSKERTSFMRERLNAVKDEEQGAASVLRARRRQIVVALAYGKGSLNNNALPDICGYSDLYALAPDAYGLKDDDTTLEGDTAVEKEVRNTELESLLLTFEERTAASGEGQEGDDKGDRLALPHRSPHICTNSSFREKNAETSVPVIRSPALAAVERGHRRAGDGGAAFDTQSAWDIFQPEYVTAKSICALRRIMKESVRHTNRVAGGSGGGRADDDDLPTFWEMS